MRTVYLQKLSIKSLGEECVVARLPWLQLTLYTTAAAKAIVEFKEMKTRRGGVVVDSCRFCTVDLTPANRHKVCAHVQTYTPTVAPEGYSYSLTARLNYMSCKRLQ